MSRRKLDDEVQDWGTWAFRGMVSIIFVVGSYSFNQFNGVIKKLSDNFEVLEQHFIENDKRITAIEVSRKDGKETFSKSLDQLDEMRTIVYTDHARIGFLEDEITHHSKGK